MTSGVYAYVCAGCDDLFSRHRLAQVAQSAPFPEVDVVDVYACMDCDCRVPQDAPTYTLTKQEYAEWGGAKPLTPDKAREDEAMDNVETARHLAVLSEWIDTSPANAVRDREAAAWGRISKVSEECGEVIAAYIGATGQNPRKGVHGCIDDVVEELLDVALTALAAVEHFNGNDGSSLEMFTAKVEHVVKRAGLI